MEPEDLLNYENEYEIKRKLGNEKIYYTFSLNINTFIM